MTELTITPSTAEYVVFIAPSKIQLDVFGAVLNPDAVAAYIRGNAQPFGLSESTLSDVAHIADIL